MFLYSPGEKQTNKKKNQTTTMCKHGMLFEVSLISISECSSNWLIYLLTKLPLGVKADPVFLVFLSNKDELVAHK